MERKYFVGVDIGTRIAGWAVVDEAGECVVHCGTWEFKPEEDLDTRLANLYRYAEYLFRAISEKTLALGIEHPFLGPSTSTALTLGKAYGVVFAAFVEMGSAVLIPKGHGASEAKIYSIFPGTAKKALTGKGNATKEEMREAAKQQFGIIDTTKEADVADAIGIALAARTRYTQERLEEYRNSGLEQSR